MRRALGRLVFLSVLSWAFSALKRDKEGELAEAVNEDASPPKQPEWVSLLSLSPAPEPPRRNAAVTRRTATSFIFAVLFFAGAAFSAGAGDMVAGALDEEAPAALAEELAPEAAEEDLETEEARRARGGLMEEDEESSEPDSAPSEAPAADEAALEPELPAEPAEESQPEMLLEPAEAEPEAETHDLRSDRPSAPSVTRRSHPQTHASAPAPARRVEAGPPVLAPRPHDHHNAPSGHDSEIEAADLMATIWLDRDLPDPTPPSRRLTRGFAVQLKAASRRHRVDWALVLGVLRARGELGAAPARPKELNGLAKRLVRLGARKDPWTALLSLEGRTAFADRALALTRYHRAVKLNALVRGLEWARPALAERLLRDERVSVYAGGRSDIEAGHTDVRVLVLIAYLAEAHGQVTISSLTSGHGVFARPGVVSAHTYGLAVDIASLGGLSIAGNQLPGGITEQAVRNVLLLPAELRPMQVISLLGLGGPSFPLGDHGDHIHVGY